MRWWLIIVCIQLGPQKLSGIVVGRLLFRVIVFYGAVMAGFSTFDIIMAKYRVKSKLFGPIFPHKLPDKVQNEKAGFEPQKNSSMSDSHHLTIYTHPSTS